MKESKSNKALIILLVLLLTAALAAVGILVWKLVLSDSDDDEIGYEMEGVVILDPSDYQPAAPEVDEIGLWYQNSATSTDGIHFTGFIGNSESNAYDMFVGIYADDDFTERLYLSKLVPPGSAIESFELDKALSEGDHQVYVAMTLVAKDEEGTQRIVDQALYTMVFSVG